MTDNPLSRIANAAAHLNIVADELDKMISGLDEKTPLVEIASTYVQLNENYTALDKARKRIYAQKDKMDKFLFPEALDRSGQDKCRIPDLGKSMFINTKYSASFIDKEAGYKWLRGRKAGDLITETVNAGTLAAYCKDLVLTEGVDPPEDIVKFSSYRTTGMVKYTPKKTAV